MVTCKGKNTTNGINLGAQIQDVGAWILRYKLPLRSNVLNWQVGFKPEIKEFRIEELN